jgi:hypothetical protein
MRSKTMNNNNFASFTWVQNMISYFEGFFQVT